jgi:hypothetical protein
MFEPGYSDAPRSVDWYLTQLKAAHELAYDHMSILERARYLGTELMLAALYVAGFGWYAATHISSLERLGELANLVVPPAFAQTSVIAPASVRVVILTIYSLAVVMVLLMSSYAAMIRKPPLASAKDVMKVVLGFVTGQLTVAGFLT